MLLGQGDVRKEIVRNRTEKQTESRAQSALNIDSNK